MLADDVVTAAMQCMGTPFLHQGRIVGRGIDCAGVLEHALKTLGLPYIDERGYPRLPYRGLIKSILDSQPSMRLLPKKSDMQRGDVLLMKFKTEPQHVAIYTGKTVIHSYADIGRVVEHDLTADWYNRTTHAYRIERPA
jgi:cell wall-associated NlpC family hydrolase